MIDLDNYTPLKKMGIAKFTDLPGVDLIGYTNSRYMWFLDGVELNKLDLKQFDILFTYSHN